MGALQRCRVTGAGTKATYQQLEVAVLKWMDEQEAAGIELKPSVLWTQVEMEARVAGIDPKVHLQENWRRAFKRRHNIRFVKVKHVSSLTVEERINLVNNFITFIRLSGHFWKIKAVHNFDECPLALDGEITRYIVLRNDRGEPVTNCPSADAKRFCTYVPVIGVSVTGDIIHKKPVVIFAGKGNISMAERRQHDERVMVKFHDNAVTDSPLIVEMIQGWFPAGGNSEMLIHDCAKQHQLDAGCEASNG